MCDISDTPLVGAPTVKTRVHSTFVIVSRIVFTNQFYYVWLRPALKPQHCTCIDSTSQPDTPLARSHWPSTKFHCSLPSTVVESGFWWSADVLNPNTSKILSSMVHDICTWKQLHVCPHTSSSHYCGFPILKIRSIIESLITYFGPQVWSKWIFKKSRRCRRDDNDVINFAFQLARLLPRPVSVFNTTFNQILTQNAQSLSHWHKTSTRA